MSNILHLDSSGKGKASVSRPLTKYCIEQYRANNPNIKVTYRDLMTSEIPFVNEEIIGAFYTPPNELTPHQKTLIAKSEQFINELIEANTYVLGVPMYNFCVPAVFKAYLDLIVRAGKTFKYEEGKPKGLLTNKTAIVVIASGGNYSKEPMKALDFVEPYLRTIFGFMGVTNITAIRVPGHDPNTIAESSKHAQEQITELLRIPQLH